MCNRFVRLLSSSSSWCLFTMLGCCFRIPYCQLPPSSPNLGTGWKWLDLLIMCRVSRVVEFEWQLNMWTVELGHFGLERVGVARFLWLRWGFKLELKYTKDKPKISQVKTRYAYNDSKKRGKGLHFFGDGQSWRLKN